MRHCQERQEIYNFDAVFRQKKGNKPKLHLTASKHRGGSDGCSGGIKKPWPQQLPQKGLRSSQKKRGSAFSCRITGTLKNRLICFAALEFTVHPPVNRQAMNEQHPINLVFFLSPSDLRSFFGNQFKIDAPNTSFPTLLNHFFARWRMQIFAPRIMGFFEKNKKDRHPRCHKSMKENGRNYIIKFSSSNTNALLPPVFFEGRTQNM